MRGDHQTSSLFIVLSFRSLGEMGIQVEGIIQIQVTQVASVFP